MKKQILNSSITLKIFINNGYSLNLCNFVDNVFFNNDILENFESEIKKNMTYFMYIEIKCFL